MEESLELNGNTKYDIEIHGQFKFIRQLTKEVEKDAKKASRKNMARSISKTKQMITKRRQSRNNIY